MYVKYYKKMNVRKGISFITVFGIIVAIICALLIGFSLGQFLKTTEIATASYIPTTITTTKHSFPQLLLP